MDGMSTRASDPMRWLSVRWEAEIDSAARRDDAATQAGIVGDLAHRMSGGYHISRQDQPATNYSCVRVDDRMGPADTASAIDMSFARTEDLVACHKRLRFVWENRTTHPLARYINAFNGWDGNGDAGRYDMVTGSVNTATPDHKTHIHLEIRRRYSDDWAAAVALRPLLSGWNEGKGSDMISFMKFSGDNAVFLTDGITASWVKSDTRMIDARFLGTEGTFSIGNSGQIRIVGNRELIGTIVGEVPPGWEGQAQKCSCSPVPAPVVMSDADVDRIAKAVLDTILDRMGDKGI